MKKKLVVLAFIGSIFSFAQTIKNGNVSTDSKRYLKDQKFDGRQPGWFISGNNSLLFSQSSFSNWVAGGVNSFALNGNVDYELNLTREKHIWDNRVVLGYGVQTNKGEGTRKTNDIIGCLRSRRISNNGFQSKSRRRRTVRFSNPAPGIRKNTFHYRHGPD